METKKKYCDYHKQECYIWKNFEGKKFCKEGWEKYKKDNKKELKKKGVVKVKGGKDGNQLYVELLDKMIRTILIAREPNECYTCGFVPRDEEKEVLQVGHFVKRAHFLTRWNLANVRLQCVKCNCELHGNLEVYERKLRKEYGDEGVDDIKSSLREINKLTSELIEWNVTNLRRIIDQLKIN